LISLSNYGPWSLISFLVLTTLLFPASANDGKDGKNEDGNGPPAEYTKRGADTCLKCHDEDGAFPVMSIFETPHGLQADERTPLAGLQCEACHGPGGDHGKKVRPDERQAPILNFKDDSTFTPAVQDQMCLNCHSDHSRSSWVGSTHEQNEVMCSDCHQVHAQHDSVLVKEEQPEVCYDCHIKQRSEMMRSSVHPVRFGILTCSDCHDAHDSWTDKLLVENTLNETCYKCHAEKRGPFLWEHAPAAEDCGSCHTPHGSNHIALLKKRPPLLCQECHSQAGHPSLDWDAGGLPGGPDPFSQQFLLGRSCLNCHTQVHGSNHPSGIKLMR
jgi:DmsE family decaheme c-type cytochrome